MSQDVAVRAVTTKKDLQRFILFPWNIYRRKPGYDAWVPPLIADEKELFDPRRHPFHKHAEIQNFLAYRGKSIVGRISAIIDQQYLRYREEGTGYFGFFESIDSRDVSGVLFKTAEDWLRKRNMKKIIGPISPTPNQILGTLIDSFELPPVIQTPYNPSYYPRLIENHGFIKEKDHFAYYMDTSTPFPERIERVANLAKKRKNIMIRPFDMKNFAREVEIVRDIWNRAWQENSDFVPWTEAEFQFMAERLRLIALPQTALLAFVDDVPAGISVPLPNINETLIKMNGRLLPFGLFRLLLGKRRCRLIRMAIMGICTEFQNIGVDAMFIVETSKRARRLGFEAAEMSLILEDNYKLVNMFANWGLAPYRTYRVYQKSLVFSP